MIAEIISLESATLELMTGRPPNRTWARLSPNPAFVEKLRILIEEGVGGGILGSDLNNRLR
jgi:hypothetical protein